MSSTDSLRDAESLAKFFHETYERLAPRHAYETRKESAVAWRDVPSHNKSLMIATAEQVLCLIEQYGLEQRIDELRNLPIIDGHRMGIAYGDHTPVVDGQYVRDRIRDLGRQKEEL